MKFFQILKTMQPTTTPALQCNPSVEGLDPEFRRHGRQLQARVYLFPAHLADLALGQGVVEPLEELPREALLLSTPESAKKSLRKRNRLIVQAANLYFLRSITCRYIHTYIHTYIHKK
jgi:hypothetical protein